MRLLACVSSLSTVVFALAAGPAHAHSESGARPAGGAAIGEVVLASSAAAVLAVALLALGAGHRSNRIGLLARAADWSQRATGLPGWTALPTMIATASLVTAVFGMYWDIALHIGVGRDEGPLANPAHFFILGGLFGIFAAGFLAMVLPRGKPSATAVRLTAGWHAPLGGVLICACGAFSLAGFPLDDLWHRIFGQDVTLWGPTHLMLIGGAGMTLVGIAVLAVEGLRARQAGELADAGRPFVRLALAVALTGGLMLGLSTFQAEFDFGVPQFRFVFQPLLIMLAASVGLVVARMWGGRGAAIGAVAFFLAIRGVLALVIGPVLGEATPHAPLYLAEAAIVELVALRVAGDRRPLAFGLGCGLGIGTLGLAAEWGWSHVWMPLPWPTELLPEAAIAGWAAAMAGAALGAWMGHRLALEPTPSTNGLRVAAVLGAVGVAALVGSSLPKPAEEGVRARVALTEVAAGPDRTVHAAIALEPRDAAKGAEWLHVTSWQGDGLVIDSLRRLGEGRYRTTEPIPVHGNWKSLIRLHRGASLVSAPIFLPRDAAIPADEVPATASFTRAFVADHRLLQREQRPAPGWLAGAGYAVVAGIALALLVLLAWGLHRLGARDVRRRRAPGPARAREAQATPAGRPA